MPNASEIQIVAAFDMRDPAQVAVHASAKQTALEAALAALETLPAKPQPVQTSGLLYGAQAQVDRLVEGVPARKVALYAPDMNGKPVFAGYGYEFGAVASAAQAKAA